MSRHKVDIVNVNTADIKVLKQDEMVELFNKYHDGDKRAKDDLINGNLKLVLSILKNYKTKVDNLDDLFQIGCIGLIKAIDNFDLSFNVKFSTYACPMIIGEIKRYIRDSGSIRVSRSIKDTAYRILKEKEQLISTFGYEPSISELSKKLDIPEYEISSALDSLKDTISMYEPIYNDGGDTIYLADQLEDKKCMEEITYNKLVLNNAIKELKDREKYIITQRYYVGKTQVELANEIGISQAQISRLEKSGLDNIKKRII